LKNKKGWYLSMSFLKFIKSFSKKLLMFLLKRLDENKFSFDEKEKKL